MNKAQSTLGTLLSYGTEAGSMSNLYSIVSTPDIGGDPEQIDTTVLYGEYMTSMPGKKSMESMEYTGNCGRYGPPNAEDAALVDEFAALYALDRNTAYLWKETYSDGSSVSYRGYPSVRMSGQEVNGVRQYTLSIMYAGDFSFTPAG